MLSKRRFTIPIFNAASMVSDSLVTHWNILELGDRRIVAQGNLLARYLVLCMKQLR